MKFPKSKGADILLCLAIAAAATFLGGAKIGNIQLDVIGAPVFAILINITDAFRISGDFWAGRNIDLLAGTAFLQITQRIS